jgi:ABC-2 type transport system permease protein
MMPMKLQVQKLWKQRFEKYAKESMGYWMYAARSNFIGFLLFLVIISSYYYAKTLQMLPTDYPYLWIVLLVLTPLLVLSPIRTLVREPDRMFLLRAEQKMGPYFRSAYRYSFFMQSFFTLVAWIILLPLYRHCEGTEAQPFLLLLAFLLFIKAANLLASWQESRFVRSRTRGITHLFRWACTLVIIWLQFEKGVQWAGAAILLAILLWFLITRRISVYQIGWDYLIDKEKVLQARLYAFFNGFVDVPQLPTRIRRRGWIAGITRWLPFKQSNTYLYLYMKTMVRTELFSIVQRITLVGFIAIVSISSDAARAVVFVAAVLITAVQLSSLGQAHRYTFWLSTYPIHNSHRADAVAWNIGGMLLIQHVLLTIALLIRTPMIYAIVPLISLGICTFICAVVFRRKLQDVT